MRPNDEHSYPNVEVGLKMAHTFEKLDCKPQMKIVKLINIISPIGNQI